MTVEQSKAQLENILPDDDYLERIIDNTQAVRRDLIVKGLNHK